MNILHQISYEIRYQLEDAVDEILTDIVTPISEFKKNPNLSVKKADGKPFAVLTNNRPSFYVLTPEVYDDILERLWEAKIAPELLEAGANYANAIEVSLDELR